MLKCLRRTAISWAVVAGIISIVVDSARATTYETFEEKKRLADIQLSLRLVSPAPGEWVHQQACQVMVVWMPPVQHVTGMSHRLWQVAEALKRVGYSISVISEQCSAFNRGGKAAELPEGTELLVCGPAVTPSSAAAALLFAAPEQVMIASWWFGHPRERGLPELFLPLLRDLLPQVPVWMLVDDMFVPYPFHYNATVDAGSVSLVGVCGAQTIALAASDAVATLTPEDAVTLRELLPLSGLHIARARFVAALTAEGTAEGIGEGIADGRGQGRGPGSGGLAWPARKLTKKLLYIGSCHAANEAALRWLLAEALPMLSQRLRHSGEQAEGYSLHIVGNVTPRTCAPALCAGGVCEDKVGHVRVVFRGYVEHIETEVDDSLVYLSPRLAGLGLSTKLMLALERGLPSVTTPHGTTGYEIDAATHATGEQGALVAEHTNAEAFADAIARLARDQDLWDTASKGAISHVARHFNGPRLEEDVRDLLLAAAKHRKDSF